MVSMVGKGIHPISYRYGSEEMRKIFDKDTWLNYMKIVEFNLLKSLVENGIIKEKVPLDKVWKAFEKVSMEDVTRWEEVTRHETMAVVMALSEKAGEYGRYIHVGATSNDILDTVLALQIRDAHQIIMERLKALIEVLIKRALEEKATPILGRTHGRAAIPVTYGFKLGLFIDELVRAFNIINEMFNYVDVGKLGGAVGSQAELYPKGDVAESSLMESLGLGKATFYTQVLPRDRLASYLLSLVSLSSILDQLGREIRNLQRSEIEEVFEPFGKGQVGSSVMPHKKNPIGSERVCGLAKVIRGYAVGILENIVLEHERDLTNSSFERCIVPELFLLLDEQLKTMKKVVEGMFINRERALENIRRQEPYIYSDLILQKATLKGADRQRVHEELRKIFLAGGVTRDKAIEMLLRNKYLSKYLSKTDIEEAMSLEIYVKAAEARLLKLLSRIESMGLWPPQ